MNKLVEHVKPVLLFITSCAFKKYILTSTSGIRFFKKVIKIDVYTVTVFPLTAVI